MLRLRLVAKWVGIGASVVFLLAQVIPVDRSNPLMVQEMTADPEIMQILRRSCFDCHSNETVWPWYSYVAPVSWLVAYDVREGRRELNFSEFNRISASDLREVIEEIGEEVEEGKMPPSIYTVTHPSARLSSDDIRKLRRWAGISSDIDRDDD
jgi:hypothetical protein